MSQKKYKRVLLKISGEVFAGNSGHGIESQALQTIGNSIAELSKEGIQVAVVNGAGNLWRHRDNQDSTIKRSISDHMGMLATVMNAAALKAAVEKAGAKTKVLSAIPHPQLTEPYVIERGLDYLQQEQVVICAGGTGNPYFTTDTAAALRAVELECDVILKATKVDGVYSADPEKDPNATLYKTLSYEDAIQKNLKVMDQTAFSLCRENQMKIVVFNMHQKNAILNAASGEAIGTIVS